MSSPSLVSFLLVFLFFTGQAVLGQKKTLTPKDLGWDLSYESVVKKNKDGSTFLAEWLKQTDRTFPSKILASWQGDRITASALIEVPATHAGEHIGIWLIRTKEKAFYWEAFDKGAGVPSKKTLSPQQLDSALKTILATQQGKPSPPNEPGLTDAERKARAVYYGFLNVYDGTASRQLLLVYEDFIGTSILSKLVDSLRK